MSRWPNVSDEQKKAIFAYNIEVNRNKQIVRVVEDSGIVKHTLIEQSDKLGYDWVRYYVGDSLAYIEYVKQEIPMGTAEDPIPWTETTLLIPNAYYIYENVRKVWMGKSGVTASWDDENFVEF